MGHTGKRPTQRIPVRHITYTFLVLIFVDTKPDSSPVYGFNRKSSIPPSPITYKSMLYCPRRPWRTNKDEVGFVHLALKKAPVGCVQTEARVHVTFPKAVTVSQSLARISGTQSSSDDEVERKQQKRRADEAE